MFLRNRPYPTSRLVGLAFPPILICIHGLLGDRHHKVGDEIFLSVGAMKDCVPGRDLGLCSWLHYFVLIVWRSGSGMMCMLRHVAYC
jgi:hypothetical protein